MELNALDLLRQRTAEAHAALERRMFVDRIMAGTLEPRQLVTLLQVNHHFLEAVERNAARFPSLDPYRVPRAQLAAADLEGMGAVPLPASSLLDTWNIDRMRGALYVALGSLLGGAMITSRLRKIPTLPQDLRFYAEDREALTVWRSFTEELRSTHDPAQLERMAQGAVDTFSLAAAACTFATEERSIA